MFVLLAQFVAYICKLCFMIKTTQQTNTTVTKVNFDTIDDLQKQKTKN